MRKLDDSDGCVYIDDDPAGEEILAVGLYVDNLTIVHSAPLQPNGDPVDQQICRCMANPTAELMREVDRIFVYLYYNQTVGLTYDAKPTQLAASSDASWETRFSTSAWLIHWQGAVLSAHCDVTVPWSPAN